MNWLSGNESVLSFVFTDLFFIYHLFVYFDFSSSQNF